MHDSYYVWKNRNQGAQAAHMMSLNKSGNALYALGDKTDQLAIAIHN